MLIRETDFHKKAQPFYLYNFRARWYDSNIGRWLSKDPIGLEGGLNLYVAFENNPVNKSDAYGKCVDDSNDSPLSPLMLLGGVKRNLTVIRPMGH